MPAGGMTSHDVVVEHGWLARHIASAYFLPGYDRDDLDQEAMLALLDAHRRYNPAIGEFRPFAGVVIRRRLVTLLKLGNSKRQRLFNGALRVVHIDGEQHDAVDLAADPQADPVEQLALREELSRIRQAARALTPLELRCLGVIVGGGSYADTGVPFKSVDNAVQRARMKLRDAA
jgi:RNA polymerase sporulation-specific sigma factor